MTAQLGCKVIAVGAEVTSDAREEHQECHWNSRAHIK